MQRETPEYPPHSLFLGNNVVIPSFKALPPGASKKDTALHRTRLLVAWANFCKPLGPHRGRSPFVEHGPLAFRRHYRLVLKLPIRNQRRRRERRQDQIISDV